MNTTQRPTGQAAIVPAREGLGGRAFALARLAWWIVFGAVVGMNLLALPGNLRLLQRACVGGPCVEQQLNLVQLRSWLLAGFSAESYAVYAVTLNLVVAALYLGVALVLFRSKGRDGMVFFTSITLVIFGGVTYSGALGTLARDNPLWWIPVLTLDYLGSVLIVAFLYLFPTGRFVPRWTRFVLVAWVLEQFLEVFENPPLSLLTLPGWFVNVFFPLVMLSALYAQIYRYRNSSNAAQRRQTRWVVLGAVLALAGFLIAVIVFSVAVELRAPVLTDLVLTLLIAVFLCLIPLSIALALLRARLWDIDLILNRTLAYGTVTAILAGILAVTSDLAKRFFLAFTGESSDLAPILATLVVVAAFEPVKHRVQGVVDRHFKYATGSFGPFGDELQRFVQFNDPGALAVRFLREAVDAFGARGGAIYPGTDSLRAITEIAPLPEVPALTVPLAYQGVTLGRLVLGPRGSGEPYDQAEATALSQMAALVARALALHPTYAISPQES